mmetsp:Transcript_67336/g.217418  ORF Transcript_67336/g.217418 Transcript_67336/m.217418 type:complete len:201 (+) Transcript_67336:100-702(+)
MSSMLAAPTSVAAARAAPGTDASSRTPGAGGHGSLLSTRAVCRMSCPGSMGVTFSMPRYAGPTPAPQAKRYEPGVLLASAARFDHGVGPDLNSELAARAAAGGAAKVADPEVGSECSTADTSEGRAPTKVPHQGLSVELLSQGCPTVGSARHGFGSCKPCAFVFKGGCRSGPSCQFCHLCPEGEMRRRRREVRVARRREP